MSISAPISSKLNTMEKILCAAIHYSGAEAEMNWNVAHPVKNIDELPKGITICGHRHHNCISTMYAATGMKTYERGSTQGFLTSLNRFVDRKEAYLIAVKAGQVKPGGLTNSNTQLYSEDLY